MGDAAVPGRELFQHFPVLLVLAFYLLSAASLGCFAYGFYRRIRKYRKGRAANRTDRLWARCMYAARLLLAHSTLRRHNRLAGWAHFGIFWGFATLFVGTLIIALDQDVIRPFSPSLQFWKGTFYLWNSLVLDLMGAALLIGLCTMAVRRWILRPPRLDYARADGRAGPGARLDYVRDDHVFLWGLIAIAATGYLNEGLRIAADRPPFETWSIVGWQLANGIDTLGLSREGARGLHFYGWWLHALLALSFIAYIPYSKAIHMLAALANLVFREPLAGRRLPPIPENADTAGAREWTDFTWKELLDLDACTKCGRCHEACPARAGGWPLSPRDVILDLRENAEAALGGRSPRRAHSAPEGALVAAPVAPLVGAVVKADALWACTTCLACVEACPVGIEHVPMFVQMRRTLIEDGTMDGNLQRVLEKFSQYGNSFGEPEQQRGEWTQGLSFPIKDARKETVDFLWFVGDFASYDPRVQPITRGVARLFDKAGLSFGILYAGERNAGNDVRRIGEEGLYQMLVEHNAGALSQANFREIVTTDPHSYSTIKFEYPDFGASHRIRHYSELLLELIDAGRLPIRNRLDAIVTYHDPCHLSRYTRITEAPRAILQALGVQLIEMPRNRANSFCCGAGGGRIWMTSAGTAERPSEQRIREALDIPGLQYFVVACPKDLAMYREAVRATGNETRLRVKDLSELVEEAVGS